MNKILLIALSLLPILAQAELITDREFDRTLDQVAADGLVEVETVAGSVEVHGYDRADIRIKAKLDDDVEGVEIDSSDSVTRIKVIYARSRKNKNGDAHLEIWVPVGNSLEVAAVSADVEVDSVQGEQRLKTVSGDIETEAFAADIRAGSVSGDVTVAGKGGGMDRVALNSVSGDINGRGLDGELSATSVSGELDLTAGTITRGDFSTTSGDIRIRSAVAPEARIDIETVSGDLGFIINGSTDGRYDLTTYSGDIDTCFGPKVERGDDRSKRHRFWLGEGKQASIRAGSMSGDIELCNK